VNFEELEIKVFDEEDRMVDMVFILDIKRIVKSLVAKREITY